MARFGPRPVGVAEHLGPWVGRGVGPPTLIQRKNAAADKAFHRLGRGDRREQNRVSTRHGRRHVGREQLVEHLSVGQARPRALQRLTEALAEFDRIFWAVRRVWAQARIHQPDQIRSGRRELVEIRNRVGWAGKELREQRSQGEHVGGQRRRGVRVELWRARRPGGRRRNDERLDQRMTIADQGHRAARGHENGALVDFAVRSRAGFVHQMARQRGNGECQRRGGPRAQPGARIREGRSKRLEADGARLQCIQLELNTVRKHADRRRRDNARPKRCRRCVDLPRQLLGEQRWQRPVEIQVEDQRRPAAWEGHHVEGPSDHEAPKVVRLDLHGWHGHHSKVPVRIATVSDLHTDYAENRDAVVKLAVAIHQGEADVVVVAGDVSHKDERIDRALRAFCEVAPRVAYIPGNHDLWYDVPFAADRPDLDTWRRYRDELRSVCEGAGAHYLPAEPLIVGAVAIVGSCGWYDYSLMAPSFRDQVDDRALALKTLDGLMWSDARFIAFRDESGHLMPDEAVARRMEAELEAHLSQVDADSRVREVVAVTHHQPFYEVVTRTGQLPWEYFCAFMGSAGLGAAIRKSPKVRTAVYGHTHVVGRYELGDLVAYGTPLGYPRERRGLSPDQVAETRVGWIDFNP